LARLIAVMAHYGGRDLFLARAAGRVTWRVDQQHQRWRIAASGKLAGHFQREHVTLADSGNDTRRCRAARGELRQVLARCLLDAWRRHGHAVKTAGHQPVDRPIGAEVPGEPPAPIVSHDAHLAVHERKRGFRALNGLDGQEHATG
jgi:hypothetical protein